MGSDESCPHFAARASRADEWQLPTQHSGPGPGGLGHAHGARKHGSSVAGPDCLSEGVATCSIGKVPQ